MSIHRNLMTVCFAAVFALGLAACSSSSDDDPPEMAMPMPEPEPDPGPTDLQQTQMDAAAAAAAAGDAATAAAASASAAEDATANIATLQTGGTAADSAAGASEAAATAMAAYMDAKAASDAAAAATTSQAAEAAWAMAVAAQGDAEDAAAMAAEMSDAAVEAAMTELHIDGTVKTVGDSSVDAAGGKLTSYGDDGKVTMITGFDSNVTRDIAAIPGRAFDDNKDSDTVNTPTDPSDDTTYRQAVAAQTLGIGKVADTSDDMARLTIVTGRAGSEMVRVFADAGATLATATDGTADGTFTIAGATEVSLNSIGMFHEAIADPDVAGQADQLDFTDVVATGSKAVEVFSYVDENDATQYVVVVSRTTNSEGTVTGMSLQLVDVTAAAAVPDTLPGSPTEEATDDALPDAARVMAALPSLEAYSHIHFGVWAGLKDNDKGDNSAIGDLGIGFVQNYDGSGVTTAHVTGTATYSGDWVGVVRGSHSTSLSSANGSATLTANFSTDEFEADLATLATLEGSLSGNTFSGTDATVSHADMNASGTFDGSFSGAIYGPDGAEAAGVFSFDGGDAGAFVGAFGGRDDDQ